VSYFHNFTTYQIEAVYFLFLVAVQSQKSNMFECAPFHVSSEEKMNNADI